MFKKRIAIISAHEGSLSWRKTVKRISNNFEETININILSDESYRTTNFFLRFKNRVIIYLVFPLLIIFSWKKLSKIDCLLVITSPFYLPLIVSLFYKKEKIIILHNDLYPEGFDKIPFAKFFNKIFKIYNLINNKHIADCKYHIFLSEYHSEKRSFKRKEIIFPPALARKVDKSRLSNFSNSVNLGYCGTMGYNHSGIELVNILNKSKFSFMHNFKFHISGALAKAFSNKASILNIENMSLKILEPLAEKDYIDFMNKIDYGIILVAPGSENTVFPSKLAAHLSFGHPIILLSDKNNFLYQFILENEIGYCIDFNSSKFPNLYNEPYLQQFAIKSNNAKKIFDRYFNHEIISDKYTHLLNI